MLPKYIKVENFSSYINETLLFDEWGNIVALMGENGAGKSSILHMITIAIFNRCPGVDAKGAGTEELIHQGCDYFKIEYCFMMDNNEYIIIREKSKKGQSLKFYINKEDHSGKLSETQKKVNDVIKMDYETFMDTVIIGQGDSASFMKKSPNERKKIITQILRLDKYDVLENYTKELRKELKINISNVEFKMNDLYDMISNKDQLIVNKDLYSNKLIELDNDIAIKENEYQHEIEEKTKYVQLKQQQDSIISRKNVVNNTIKNIFVEIDKYKNLEIEINNVFAKKEDTFNKLKSIDTELERYSTEQNNLLQQKVELNTKSKLLLTELENLKNKFARLKNYNECNCQFCGQNISNEYKNKHLSDIKNEGNKINEEITNNKNKLVQIDQNSSLLIENINALKREKQQLDSLAVKIHQAEVKIESVKSKILDLSNRLDELKSEQTELEQINIIDIEHKSFNDDYIKNELVKLRNQQTFYNTEIGIINSKLTDIDKYEIEYKNITDKYNRMKEEIMIYEELQKAWSKNGIQAIIIDNILPQIEDEINKYLKILSDDKIFIKFITQKESKNGNKSETLEIIVSDSKGSRSYERYSGGQKTRIDFACHIGMSKFLAKRSGSNMDLFIIDEGIGTLDESGKQNFLDTVNLLSDIFKQVIVISHIPDIIESFDNKVIVTNDIFNGSKVNVMR